MSTRSLYLVIVILVGIIGYLFFRQTPTPVPTLSEQPATTTVPTSTTPLEEVSPAATTTVKTTESVTIEGLFLGLTEEETDYQKSFFYLLLDDGTEVVRVDLRPLLGYSLIDPINKLGVDRGQRVRLTGVMEGGQFVIQSINAVEE